MQRNKLLICNIFIAADNHWGYLCLGIMTPNSHQNPDIVLFEKCLDIDPMILSTTLVNCFKKY